MSVLALYSSVISFNLVVVRALVFYLWLGILWFSIIFVLLILDDWGDLRLVSHWRCDLHAIFLHGGWFCGQATPWCHRIQMSGLHSGEIHLSGVVATLANAVVDALFSSTLFVDVFVSLFSLTHGTVFLMTRICLARLICIRTLDLVAVVVDWR